MDFQQASIGQIIFFFFKHLLRVLPDGCCYLSQAWNLYTCQEIKQDIQPILTKIISYQTEALKNPVLMVRRNYGPTEIMDPHVKIKYINEDSLSAAVLANYFTNQAHTFEAPSDTDTEIVAPPLSDEDNDQPCHYKRKIGPISSKNKYISNFKSLRKTGIATLLLIGTNRIQIGWFLH